MNRETLDAILSLGRAGYTSTEIANDVGTTVGKARKLLVKYGVVRKNGLHGSKPVLQYNLSGVLLKEYPSATQAYCATGVASTNISECCRGNLRQAGGFLWAFKYGQ